MQYDFLIIAMIILGYNVSRKRCKIEIGLRPIVAMED